MTTEALSLADRLKALFRHLGIERAHVAARDAADWRDFAVAHPDRVATLVPWRWICSPLLRSPAERS
jgi:hypothetical protein